MATTISIALVLLISCVTQTTVSISYDKVLNDAVFTTRNAVYNSGKNVTFLRGYQLRAAQELGNKYYTTLNNPGYNLEDLVGITAGANVSGSMELCQRHINMTLQALPYGFWALRMVDAFGKPKSDFLNGNLPWVGSYDECIGVKADYVAPNSSYTVHPFSGQYCIAKIQMDKYPVDLGLCVPSSCTGRDIRQLMKNLLQTIPNVQIRSAYCKHAQDSFDKSAIAALVIIGFLSTLLIIGTTYDVISMVLKKYGLQRMKIPDNDQSIDICASDNKPLIQKEVDDIEGKLGKLLRAFSVYTNGKKLLSTSQGKDSLTAINGIRFLSISWVVLGHSYIFGMSSYSNATVFIGEMLNRWTFQAVSNAFVSVDSFFALSGFLLSFLVLKEMDKKNGRINWFMFYFHRFWRLTPPYMLLLMVNATLSRHFGDGPMWPEEGFEKDHCRSTWWWNFLYINNLKDTATCFGWSWYLANDMQFFVVSPVILYPLFHFQFVGLGILFLFLIGTIVTPGVVSTSFNLPPSMFGGIEGNSGSSEYMKQYYVKPYCRMGPYLIGILFGYLLYKTKGRFKINKALNIFLWSVAIALGLTIVYGLRNPLNNDPLSQEVSSLYNATHRTVWGICLCWVIFACSTGNGGYINTILSWSVFTPLARLSYCVYLVHPIIMYTFYNSLREPIILTDFEGRSRRQYAMNSTLDKHRPSKINPWVQVSRRIKHLLV